MTPEEVIDKAGLLGAVISKATLVRYTQQGLVSTPDRGSGGRGVGRWSEYPEMAPIEAATAKMMISGEASIRYFDEKQRVSFAVPLVVSAKETSSEKLKSFIEESGLGKYSYLAPLTTNQMQQLTFLSLDDCFGGTTLYLRKKIAEGLTEVTFYLYAQTYIELLKQYIKC
ncbi:hypothetical protein [Anaeroarcus burkinensis]|uniref:hypothetical protein n=1 Tax=Anaeroarcus burkinensis TaxID=82376 RepID=UPI00047F0EFB|nr:hypothetical protein [Anaeroarcus burkinensis]